MSYRHVRLQDGRTEMAWVNDPVPFNWSALTLGGVVASILIVNFFVFAALVGRYAGVAGFLDVLKAGGLFYVAIVAGGWIRRFTARFRRH